MFEPNNNLECRESVYKTLEELEQQNKWLRDEKTNLLEIEAKLQARAFEEVESRKQENSELKLEIEQLKNKCGSLTQFLNKKALVQIP
jgi:hypothetical protein